MRVQALAAPYYQVDLSRKERLLGHYEFDDGTFVKISASNALRTEEALEMVEILIGLKRAELQRKSKRFNAEASVDRTAP